MISCEELAKNFEKILGEEESKKLIESTAKKLGIGKKDFYSKEEAIRICETLANKEKGFISIIAKVVLAKLYVS